MNALAVAVTLFALGLDTDKDGEREKDDARDPYSVIKKLSEKYKFSEATPVGVLSSEVSAEEEGIRPITKRNIKIMQMLFFMIRIPFYLDNDSKTYCNS